MQMTIRNIPAGLRKQVEKIAKDKGTSLNQAALECMARGCNFDLSDDRAKIDLSGIFGTVGKAEAKRIMDAVEWSNRASLRAQKRDENENRTGHQSVRRSHRRSA